MNLINIQNGKRVEGDILEIEKDDFSKIKKSKQFTFDWSLEKEYQIWKLILVDTDEILGLMSLEDHPDEFRLQIKTIEVAIKNKGREKIIDGIAGCLIAHAAEIAFGKGYFGFVSLVPKTRLIDHYTSKYGFKQFGRELAIEGITSQQLISKYLER